MKFKKLIALLLSAVIIVSALIGVTRAFAGDVQWRYDNQSATLYIYGSGDMDDYSSPYEAPWSTYLLLMNKVIIENGVTSVGNCSFSGAEHLNNVSIADTVTKIGTEAFSSCNALKELTFSESIISIGDVSFSKIGSADKPQFVLNVYPGTFSLYYAIKNSVPFNCNSAKTGSYSIKIPARSGGMKAYFPYTAKVNATFIFYSESKYDPAGYLYDSNFNILEDNDDYDVKYSDSMEPCDFSFSYNLVAGKTYYFATDIINPNMKADYKVTIGAYNYTLSGGIYAMSAPGEISSIKLTNARFNGVLNNGNYSINVTSVNQSATITCDGVTWVHTFTPDDGANCNIPVLMCDVNQDRVVNAKDYAIMQKNNSVYKQFFTNFMNYKY